MVFIGGSPGGPGGGSSAAFLGCPDPIPATYCPDVARCRCWYHLYRFPQRHPPSGCAKVAVFAVENHTNDTDDTKPSSRDTPTIQPVLTISIKCGRSNRCRFRRSNRPSRTRHP